MFAGEGEDVVKGGGEEEAEGQEEGRRRRSRIWKMKWEVEPGWWEKRVRDDVL